MNSTAVETPNRAKSILIFVLHQLVGTWGIAFIAAFGLSSLFDLVPNFGNWKPSMASVEWVLTGNPFYPVQILAGLCIGWLLSRRLHHRSMLWIWILPLSILVYVLVAEPAFLPWTSMLARPGTIQSRLSYYFGWGCRPQERCLDQLAITMPFYASVAYSLGALRARTSSRGHDHNFEIQTTSVEN